MATQRRFKNSLKFSSIVLPFLLIAAILFLSTKAYTKDISDIIKGLEKALPKKGDPHHGDWVKKFQEIKEYLIKKEKELQRLDLSIAAGFHGHKAGEESLYKLNIEADINKSEYPRQARFKAVTSVSLKNNELQEDVTSLALSYDYYLKPWLETYGFVERFTDQFLSIQERYEIGGGFKFELNLFNNKEKIGKELNASLHVYSEYEKYLDMLDKLPKNKKEKPDEKIDTKSLREQLKDLKKEEDRIKQGLKKKHAMLTLGLALSSFNEIERAKIETVIVKKNGINNTEEATKSIPLDGKQRFRVVLRPSIVIRPTDKLTLLGLIYWKHPLFKPFKPEGKLDYRTDAMLRAELTLLKSSSWADKVSLIFEYQRHYDNLPPQFPPETIAEYEAEGKDLVKRVAEDTHEEYRFMLKISF